MHISNLKLWNFRKFGSGSAFDIDDPDLDINLKKGLNVLIGENDSGKTAIIDAIKLVLKTHSYEWIRYNEDDFYQDTKRFRIEIRFSDLEPSEAKNFTEWLGWEGTGEDAEPYLNVILDVQRNSDRILPSQVRAGVDEDGYLLTGEAKEYLKTTYLKPLRDAESELIAKKNSRLSQILLGDKAFKNNQEDHELLNIFKEFNQALKEYFKGDFELVQKDGNGEEETIKPTEGKEIKDKVDNYIQSFYSPDHEVEFEAAKGELKSILEKLNLHLKDEEYPGLGTLNRLFMAAELLHLNKENWSGIRLGLIEELEAHLHPQAQMKVIEALQEQEEIQLILTTHSPNLASKVKLKSLVICNNSNALPMGSTHTKLDESDYKFLERFLDTTKSNLFFAKGVILVEGWAEELILPSLANKIGLPLTENGVSVINLGNTAFLRYSRIFQRSEEESCGFNVPVSIVTDLDLKPSEEDGNKDNAIEQKKEKYDGQTVNTFVSPHWTLEYCLAKSESISEKFQDIVKEVHSRTNWDDFDQKLSEKLDNKSLDKTEIAYRLAEKLDGNSTAEDPEITINRENQNDTIHYLIKAIEYACRN